MYTSKDVAPIETVKYFSDKRLKVQKEFLDFDSTFRILIKEELKKDQLR